MPEEPSTCPVCDGDGVELDGSFCTTCMGGGSVPVPPSNMHRYFKESQEAVMSEVADVKDKVNDIKQKVDEIKTVVDLL